MLLSELAKATNDWFSGEFSPRPTLSQHRDSSFDQVLLKDTPTHISLPF